MRLEQAASRHSLEVAVQRPGESILLGRQSTDQQIRESEPLASSGRLLEILNLNLFSAKLCQQIIPGAALGFLEESHSLLERPPGLGDDSLRHLGLNSWIAA